jgi:DNA-3-methyladenine glycosylase II
VTLAAVERQVARMLSLDHDARGFVAMAAREAPIGAVLAQYPGFRPVCFPSPYEAAVWGVLAQRVSMGQAAAVKRMLAEARGDVLELGGERLFVVPAPATLVTLDGFAGVSAEKWERLRSIAAATLDGLFDAERLRALDPDEAIAKLSELRGVGAWTAQHIYLRGCGIADVLPDAEPRVMAGVAHAYGLEKAPDAAAFAAIAERWRPFRMWVAVLVSLHLSRTGDWRRASAGARRGATPGKGAPKGRRGRKPVS